MFGGHFEVPAKTRADLDKKGRVLEGTVRGFIVQSFGSVRQGGSVGKLVVVSDPRKGGDPPAGFEIVNSWISSIASIVKRHVSRMNLNQWKEIK